jgi:hypothetical protein
MIQLKVLANFLLFSLLVISCTQVKTNQSTKSPGTQNKKEKSSKDISDSTNVLSSKVEILDVEFTSWGCACPNWIQSKDNQRNDTTKNYIRLHFYIEPAKKSLELPNRYNPSEQNLRLTGQFYAREDYPKGTVQSEEPMSKAKVFRYTKLEIVEKSTN